MRGKPPIDRLCSAHAKQRGGERCENWTMPGKAVCYAHGGTSTGAPPTHGRYSKSLPPDLTERYEYFKSDPLILDLRADLALARTFYERFMSTIVDGHGISAELGDELRKWGETISKLAERADKILHGERYTITVEGLATAAARQVDIVMTALDEAECEAVRRAGGGEDVGPAFTACRARIAERMREEFGG